MKVFTPWLLSAFAAATVVAAQRDGRRRLASGPPAVQLLSAGDYAILAGASITSTGVVGTVINGNMALYPGTAVSGFPPAVCNGVTHFTDPIALQAQSDLTAAYNDAQGRTDNRTLINSELSGVTLNPGTFYSTSGTFSISSSALTLDALGDAAGVFIFQAATTISTTGSVTLAGSASAASIFWACGTSCSVGASSTFYGSMMADQSITVGNSAAITGRLLARIAAITLDETTVTTPTALPGASPHTTYTPTNSVAPTPSLTPTHSPTASNTPSISTTASITSSPASRSSTPSVSPTSSITPSAHSSTMTPSATASRTSGAEVHVGSTLAYLAAAALLVLCAARV